MKQAQKFIATRLKEWDTTIPNCTTTTTTGSSLSGEIPAKLSASDQNTLFLETARQHKEAMDSQFQSYHEDIENRIRQEIGVCT